MKWNLKDLGRGVVVASVLGFAAWTGAIWSGAEAPWVGDDPPSIVFIELDPTEVPEDLCEIVQQAHQRARDRGSDDVDEILRALDALDCELDAQAAATPTAPPAAP